MSSSSSLQRPARISKVHTLTHATDDAGASSTHKSLISGGFEIKYVDESESQGDYITDDVGLSGDNTIKGLQMGMARKSTVGVGIMGIGYTENEAADVMYPNIIDEMVDQGLIATKAYSLYLDTQDATHGEILFGGLDAKKFIGQLTTLPLQARRNAGIDSFTVAMTGLSIGPKDNPDPLTGSNFAIATLLDSGTTLTYLPDALVANLIKVMGAYDDIEENGSIWVDCSLPETYPDYVLAYQFGGKDGPVINVPLKEVIFDIPDAYQDYFNLPWKTTCYLGIMPSGGDTHYLLGDSFLRSAYVVYDIDNNELSIANTNFEATEEEIIEITKGSTIPQATGVASQVTVTADEERIGGVGERTSALTGKITATGSSRPVLIGGGARTTTDASGSEATAEGADQAEGSPDAGGRLTPGGSFGVWSLVTVWGAFAVLGGAAVLA